MQKGISDAIRGHLSKHPAQRSEILRIAGATRGTDLRGADRKLPAATGNMKGKVLPSAKVDRPSPLAPPRETAPSAADWPTTRSTFASGLARPRVRGSLPSREGPPR
jgi:hypothetical protein